MSNRSVIDLDQLSFDVTEWYTRNYIEKIAFIHIFTPAPQSREARGTPKDDLRFAQPPILVAY